MEEGSMRCDANVSVRKKGETKLGAKVEIKNLNSIRNVKRAIDAEALRLIDLIENGGTVQQETRSFDADTGKSFATREKEDADDYRYFPEPDLTPFSLKEEFIEDIRKTIPLLPYQRIEKYKNIFQLSEYDAGQIASERDIADYFERILSIRGDDSNGENVKAKSAANWILGPVRSWLNENAKTIDDFPVSPAVLSELISLVERDKVSFTIASGKIFHELIKDPARSPRSIAESDNLLQDSDKASIDGIVDEVILQWHEKVKEYKKGKKGLLALFVGEVMKRSKGKADPKLTNQLLIEKLK
jgi:aspartyl-tRNA(Asn)/glutamyl-tRNA(Gln) amidotransferase subunit B